MDHQATETLQKNPDVSGAEVKTVGVRSEHYSESHEEDSSSDSDSSSSDDDDEEEDVSPFEKAKIRIQVFSFDTCRRQWHWLVFVIVEAQREVCLRAKRGYIAFSCCLCPWTC